MWQAAFGLSFAQVGMLKTLYSGSMAALQVPASLLAERVGERVLLALGTLVAAAGFIAAGWSAGFLGLAPCLMLSGAGASVQHPLGSALTSRAFGVFYTLTIGAGALSPSLYGLLGDSIGVPRTFGVIAAAVLLVLPLTLGLRPALRALTLANRA